MIRENFCCVRNGLTLRGLAYRPEGSKLPAAIVSHGFMANYRTTEPIAKRLAAMGFAAFVFDFNGGGIRSRSDGKSVDMSVLTEKEDLKAVIEAVSALPYVNENDITLVGCSQGGFVSAMVASDLKDRIGRLILFYPALCIPDDARRGQMMFAKFDPKNIPAVFRCGPMKLGRRYATDVVNMDPFAEIGGYSGPVLIIHGEKDDVVAPSYSEKAFDTFLSAQDGRLSAACQLVIISGANHGFGGLKSRIWNNYAFFAIEKFLQGKAPILDIDVRLTRFGKEKQGRNRHVKAYFDGQASSPYFKGSTRPGAFDDQIWIGRKPKQCSAGYVLDGTDFSGNACSIRIRNNMNVIGKPDWNRGWVPEVHTNSESLAFLNTQKCETYAEMRKSGPFIHIYAEP